MREYIDTAIICPNCGLRILTMERYASRGNCHTWRRIRCQNATCKVDTGQQPTLMQVYEVLMAEYYGAKYNGNYTIKIEEEEHEDL